MEALLNSLTIAQAMEWNLNSEKWIFCTDILDDNDLKRTATNVNAIEKRFEQLLRKSAGIINSAEDL